MEKMKELKPGNNPPKEEKERLLRLIQSLRKMKKEETSSLVLLRQLRGYRE